MIMRLEQRTIDSVKTAMQEFLPHYINVDANLPETYHYEFGMFYNLLQWRVTWTDIEYTTADLDIADVQINLSANLDRPVLSVKFPAIKRWQINAKQDVNFWFLPDFSDVQLIFDDFAIDFDTDFKLDENGYLDPIVYKADIHFGDSYLYHDNPITAFVMHQFIYFAIIIVENSIYFIGEYVFTRMGGPLMDRFFNHYQFPFAFPSLVRGQNTWDLFEFDFRQTAAPEIHQGYMDLFFSGELMYN